MTAGANPKPIGINRGKNAFLLKIEKSLSKKVVRNISLIFTEQKIVIELQNSSINPQTIRERENFYGDKLLWIINGSKYRNHISISKTEEMQSMNLENFDIWSSREVLLSSDFINEYLGTKKEFSFNWKYPIRSWSATKRPVFLDIGEDFMLWLKKGIGCNYGKFNVYSKKVFFQKYYGDYNIYKKLNEHKTLNNYKFLVNTIDKIAWSFEKKLSNYTYPPSPSLKVYDNLSRKTHLSKIRIKELIIPNGNNKGVIFIFCFNNDKPKMNGVFICNTSEVSIGRKFIELIKISRDGTQLLLDNKWVIDYIASIPLNKNDLKKISSSFTQHLRNKIKENLYGNESNVLINITSTT